MRKLIFVLFLSLAPIIISAQPGKGFNIDVSVSGLQDSALYLAYHFGDKQYIRDTIFLDKAGKGRFKGDEILPEGIYMIVLPGKKYFEVLVSDDQHFSVACNYPNFTETLKFIGSEENTSFVAYQKKWVAMQQKASVLSKRVQNNKGHNDSLKILLTKQKDEEEKMKAYLRNVEAQNNGNLLATLVKSLLPLEMPEFKVPAGTRNPDSLRWVWNYHYNKNHFFDNLDLTDERLLRTPILQARLEAFFKNVVIQAPDSINQEIDKIIRKVEGNYNIFQFVSVFLFNHFRQSPIMGHDAVMVKLADDIYLSGKADWINKEFKDDLRKQVELIRPNMIGKKAHNLIMDSYKGIFVSLDDIEKEFTILYFWEPDCGHCKEATPKLKDYYDMHKDYSMEIFAVCTTDEKGKWSKYIEDNKLKWINGWDPERKTHFDYYFNVQSTPLLYILDRNKTIIAKKLPVEEIDPFIRNYIKYFR